jgi:gamma-glutamylcyclotransferase (GGCT)/AIG2-like uncharacterized protein YtfP
MNDKIYYFTYGTLQRGYPNFDAYAEGLGLRIGCYRTRELFPLIVVKRPACPNPGCKFEHRMTALIEDKGKGHRVEGEVYQISQALLNRLDRLESYSADDEANSSYLRRTVAVEPIDGDSESLDCQVYFIADGEGYERLFEDGSAERLQKFTLKMAQGRLKPCCRQDPNHTGPHTVVDLFV